MKKIHILFSFVFIFVHTQSFAQGGEKKEWPSSERHAFISECMKTGQPALSEDSARFYCYCMAQKVEAKYPTVEDAAKITEADMKTPAWQKDITDCLDGFWSRGDRDVFLTECIKSAKANLADDKAKDYCECMLFKVENAYPKSEDAGQLTNEKINSPEWQTIINGCLTY